MSNSYYGILPISVRRDPHLSKSQKLFYAELTTLIDENGNCNKYNSYFAELFGVSNSTVQGWIWGLQKRGHIDFYLDNLSGNHHQRLIYLTHKKSFALNQG